MSDNMMKIIYCVIFILVGIFCLVAVKNDWDFFMEDRKARPVVALLGRNGARIFYGILGALFILLGIVFLIVG